MSELNSPQKLGFLTGEIKPTDNVNSGGAVTKLMGDDTFGVRGGGGGGGSNGEAARGAVIDSPQSKPETYGK